MTTNASVTTHTWPVAVIAVEHPPLTDEQPAVDQIRNAPALNLNLLKVIPPNTPGVPHDVCLWEGRSILLVEMPEPPKQT
jgi:hypothetical protein